MSRDAPSGLEVAFALLFAAAIWIFQISLFFTRLVRNLRAEWDKHDQPQQRNEPE
jgi:hypothetical protein